MIRVKKIAHAIYEAPDIESQLEYYTEILGLTVTDRSKDAVYLASTVDHHSIVLHQGAQAQCQSVGFQVGPDDEGPGCIQSLGHHADRRDAQMTRCTNGRQDDYQLARDQREPAVQQVLDRGGRDQLRQGREWSKSRQFFTQFRGVSGNDSNRHQVIVWPQELKTRRHRLSLRRGQDEMSRVGQRERSRNSNPANETVQAPRGACRSNCRIAERWISGDAAAGDTC
ncbi:MAG: VOC family protein [Hyphomicrobiales bacterium]|nr:VOC family protein [Hyphomicrobiales bacterium]